MKYITDKASLKEALEYAHYELDNVGEIVTTNIFAKIFEEDFYKKNPHLAIIKMMSNPDYFGFTSKLLLNIDLFPFQIAILQEMWRHAFPMFIGSRGAGKTFLLGTYALLRAILIPNSKVILTGAGFRQAKLIFDYAERHYSNSPLLQSIVGDGRYSGIKKEVDRLNFYIGSSVITAIPIGQGDKIRGLRATCVISDEFNSVPIDVYENVIGGFGIVKADPMSGVKEAYRNKLLRQMGQEDTSEDKYEIPNQSIISGTAGYTFESFYKYYQRYKGIIESNGNIDRLTELLDGGVPDKFDHKQYCIIRLPIEAVPEGFMDIDQLTRAKATVHTGVFLSEYGAIFPTDSTGFFKRSLIQSCVAEEGAITIGGVPIVFESMLIGNSNRKYVFGIDPAAQNDNFAIVVLEIWPTHRRVVYTWTTNMKTHAAKLEAKLYDLDYYSACIRKIRDLMRVFPCERICIDSQGGGLTLQELLHDPQKAEEGEPILWPIVEEGKEKPTDEKAGLHIIEMCNFANSEWVSNANHDLRKDMESKVLLFPRFDVLNLEYAANEDEALGRIYDTQEDCVREIEALKDELCMIVTSVTPTTGRLRWDTPETKNEVTGRKERLKKDRYSALLMANYGAKQVCQIVPQPIYMPAGGVVNGGAKSTGGKMYMTGPDWFVNSEYNKMFGVS